MEFLYYNLKHFWLQPDCLQLVSFSFQLKYFIIGFFYRYITESRDCCRIWHWFHYIRYIEGEFLSCPHYGVLYRNRTCFGLYWTKYSNMCHNFKGCRLSQVLRPRWFPLTYIWSRSWSIGCRVIGEQMLVLTLTGWLINPSAADWDRSCPYAWEM